MIGNAIKEAREEKGFTQKYLGEASCLSQKTISAIETCRRSITQENLKNICNELNNPIVYMETINEMCGDAFSLQWLDGDAADLHRASVKEKVMEELKEAIESIHSAKVYNMPKTCKNEDLKLILKSIQDTIDVYKGSAIYIAVMCREYGVDIRGMFRIQKQKLINKGYLKSDNVAK
ncbi:transcriptional regulator [Clostridium carboxidivorans P7]|uniref:Transcriptional regulator, XRE family n=1 Tax=Clostridium carboxidivorans P7 TaxID=536227 RepID=C6PZQ9_9CLOT|nr:helix-turn-helix transcriptional regulator [Clostridium carboxidivorans]AKN32630.1 transcriptional regulator [Clostridium carboxidivorans P7]EET85259.1 transcriptional regulator, XRE family [Clostridium carboxidivorans P7]EFG90148.1 helix-turn-helix domain-containing protein [Clostridium carboxidivorans P7]